MISRSDQSSKKSPYGIGVWLPVLVLFLQPFPCDVGCAAMSACRIGCAAMSRYTVERIKHGIE